MRHSRAFWAAFALLAGTTILDVANPCVGIFALFHLVLTFVSLMAYIVMRAHAKGLVYGSRAFEAARRHGGEEAERLAREASRRTTSLLSRMLLGMAAVFTVFASVATLLLTMIGLDPSAGGKVMFPVQLAPFDAAFDLWAISAVMSVAAAVLLVVAGGDVRRWLRMAA